MKTIYKTGAITTVALVGAWLYARPAWTQQASPPPLPVQQAPVPQPSPDQQNQGIQVLNQGPVHEAFAEPITGQPQPGPIVSKQPPNPVDEVPPDEQLEGSNVQWIPGYWQWDDVSADFVWVSGVWRDVPPEKDWVPGYWDQVQGGWQWVPGYWADAQQQQVTYLPPPPASIDTGPSAPATNPNDVYVPGVWVYRENRYFWRPGFFIAYNPNWVYVPARYIWSPAGYVFIDGYWDFPLQRRGLLFAPVVFNPGLFSQPNWTYTPQYVVPTTTLVTALFVRPAYASYYFGDYFGTAYQQRGFVPWVDYRIGRYSNDVLFNHFYLGHRNDERYLRDLRTLYAERQAGRAPRPPRTLAELNRESNTRTGAVSLVAPLREVNREGIKLQRVPQERIAQEHNVARQFTSVRTERQKLERNVVSQNGPITKPTERPRTANWQVPRVTRPTPQTPARVQRPELPRQPQHVERPLPQHQPLTPERAPREPMKQVETRRPTEARPGARPGETQQPRTEQRPPNEARPGERAQPPRTEQRPPNEARPGARPGEGALPAREARPNEARPVVPQKEARPNEARPTPPKEARPAPNEARPTGPPKQVQPERPAPKQEKKDGNKEPPRAKAPEARPAPAQNRPAVATPARPQATPPRETRPEPQQRQTPVIHENRPQPPQQHAAPPPAREARPQPPQHAAPQPPQHAVPPPAHEARPQPAPQQHPAPPPQARSQPPHQPPPAHQEPPRDKEKR